MPISLPPISRRRFLSRSVIGAAGLLLAPRAHALFGLGHREDHWALLSDTHIAADRSTVSRGINMAEHLTAAAKDVAAAQEDFRGAFVCGDCAYNDGQKEDYATFTDLLQPIRKAKGPVHLALGNHDNRERFREALNTEKVAKRPVADRQAALIKAPRANWFVLDSLEKTLSTPGVIGREQLDWLAKALDEHSSKPALILVHHNPGALANVRGLKDTEAFMGVIRPRKQVKAYVFGHTHRWSVTPDESGIHLINLPPVAYVFGRENPSGWIKATVREDGMRLELRCIDPNQTAQGQVTDLKWRS
jgi:Icc-related predicted phosphoesterase